MEIDRTDSRQERRDNAFDDDEHGVEKSNRYHASGSSSSRDKDRRRREEKEVRDRDHHHHHHRSNKDKNRSNKEKEKEKEKKDRPKEKEREREREKERVKEKTSKKAHEEEDYDRRRGRVDEDDGEGDFGKEGKVSFRDDDEKFAHKKEDALGGERLSAQEIEQRISEMKESRTKKSEGGSEISSWVSRSRKIEKEKVKQLSKIFEEQDNVGQEDSEDEEGGNPISLAVSFSQRILNIMSDNLGGVKVLHGLDKVMEGGAVVLTLKDQSVLAGRDLNEDVDMLENVEIGEQKCRDEAYKAAKKKSAYDDMFNEDPASEKKILPQYDDSTVDEGVTLDASGRVNVEAEKKLEELRRRLQGASGKSHFEDLNSSGKISSDYYTQEEMLQFKKPKKKRAIRKREKLDIDALEAEAVSAGLGIGDLGSRDDARRQSIREEQERAEAEMRKSAYAAAYAKADEASKSLLLEQIIPAKIEEDELFADDQEDLFKSLERARKLALKKQGEEALGPEGIAQLATSKVSSQVADDQNNANGESQETKVVFTEMEEFVWGLQLNQEAHKPESEDVFMDEDEAPIASAEDMKFEAGGWTEVEESPKDENHIDKDKEEIVPDETIHEAPVGKGLSGTLKLLKDRGELKETVDWGGRNMDKKKSKLVGIVDDGNNRFKDIRIERTDEFGRILTPKEAFRVISHKFHGKGPGKMKQEKRMKQHQEEMKLKQMKNSDTPSLSVERMREAQAQLKTPYLVLSGHVKPGQNSDPKSGFTTVEKELPGDLTPMLGDRKVEHFLGIKRKAEPGNSNIPKKPKT